MGLFPKQCVVIGNFVSAVISFVHVNSYDAVDDTASWTTKALSEDALLWLKLQILGVNQKIVFTSDHAIQKGY